MMPFVYNLLTQPELQFYASFTKFLTKSALTSQKSSGVQLYPPGTKFCTIFCAHTPILESKDIYIELHHADCIVLSKSRDVNPSLPRPDMLLFCRSRYAYENGGSLTG